MDFLLQRKECKVVVLSVCSQSKCTDSFPQSVGEHLLYLNYTCVHTCIGRHMSGTRAHATVCVWISGETTYGSLLSFHLVGPEIEVRQSGLVACAYYLLSLLARAAQPHLTSGS